MPDPPLVSVVVPTYNGARHLGEALRSALAQTHPAVEILVVVDGSTDETGDVLAGFGDQITVIRQENRGGGAALNRGVDAATGKYVAPLDDDDVWHPEKLATQAAFLEARPDCVGCTVVWETSGAPGVPVFDREALCDARGVVRRPIRHHFAHVFWRPSFSFMRREAMAGLRYCPHKQFPYDREFELAFFARGGIGVAGTEILGRYRIHAGNVSRSADRPYQGTLRLHALRQAGHFDALDAEQQADLDHFLGQRARHVIIDQLRAGRRRQAAHVLALEWRTIARSGSARFVAAFPALWAAPTSLIGRVWPSRGALHQNRPADAEQPAA